MKKETYWRIAGEFRNRWWKQPICWLIGHHRVRFGTTPKKRNK